jgi:hypothetical protein
LIRATIEHVEGRYFASATDEATPWLRIAACSHKHRSARLAARCLESTRRRAERLVLQRVARAHRRSTRT